MIRVSENDASCGMVYSTAFTKSKNACIIPDELYTYFVLLEQGLTTRRVIYLLTDIQAHCKSYNGSQHMIIPGWKALQ